MIDLFDEEQWGRVGATVGLAGGALIGGYIGLLIGGLGGAILGLIVGLPVGWLVIGFLFVALVGIVNRVDEIFWYVLPFIALALLGFLIHLLWNVGKP